VRGLQRRHTEIAAAASAAGVVLYMQGARPRVRAAERPRVWAAGLPHVPAGAGRPPVEDLASLTAVCGCRRRRARLEGWGGRAAAEGDGGIWGDVDGDVSGIDGSSTNYAGIFN
jgi:hypothetical protein